NFRTDGEGASASQEYEANFQLQPIRQLVINGNFGYRYNDLSNRPFFRRKLGKELASLACADNIKRVIPSEVEESRNYCVDITRSFDYGGKSASAQDDHLILFVRTKSLALRERWILRSKRRRGLFRKKVGKELCLSGLCHLTLFAQNKKLSSTEESFLNLQ
ncbi:MAG: hypothetical protein IKU48_04455, partial [Clostridia bacterium]|nr:hypothetical protein [Clostridia bacterium]